MDGVAHITSDWVQVGPVRRQRCAWCGALLNEDNFTLMAWPLNEDGTDPGPPGAWPAGVVIEKVGEAGFSITRIVPEDEWPLSADGSGEHALPENCCGRLDPAVTQ